MTGKDAFDLWWEWAEKPVDSILTIPVEIHDADLRRSRSPCFERLTEVAKGAICCGAVAAPQRGSAAMKNKLCVRSTDALKSSHQNQEGRVRVRKRQWAQFERFFSLN